MIRALTLLLCLAAVPWALFPDPAAARQAAPSPIPPDTGQLLVALADSWEHPTGTLALFERATPDSAWQVVERPFPVCFGRTGLAWGRGLHGADILPPGPVKREGDGKAPAGVFALGPAFAYEPQELGQVKMPVLRAQDTLICVDDAASGLYNTLVNTGVDIGADAGSDLPSHERMRRPDELYRFGLVVRHNMDPAVPGSGSCIFLHIWRGPQSPTSGCTAMAQEHMKALIQRLDPAQKPLLVQLPKDEYARLRGTWGLP